MAPRPPVGQRPRARIRDRRATRQGDGIWVRGIGIREEVAAADAAKWLAYL